MRSNKKVAPERVLEASGQDEPDEILVLERLREEGDYATVADLLPDDWPDWNVFDERAIRVRLLAADVFDQRGDIEGVSRALEPYIDASDRVPFAVADRLFVALAAYKYRLGKPTEGLQLVEQALALLRLRNNTFFLGEALHLQAELLCAVGKLDEAITSFTQAATSYTNHGRRYQCGLVLVSLGEALFRAAKLTEALAALEEADKLLTGCRDRYCLASARESLAAVQCVMGHHHEALKNLAQAAGIYQDLGCDPDLAIALGKTALVFHLMKRQREAIAYQSQALDTAARTEIESYCGFQELMVQAYLEAGDLQKAEAAVRLALEGARSFGTSLEQAEAERTAGRLYLLQENYAEAASTLSTALKHARNAQHRVLVLEIRALLGLSTVNAHPPRAARLITRLEAEIRHLPLPEIQSICDQVRQQLLAPTEDLFVISINESLTLGQARAKLVTWLWKHAIQKTDGDPDKAAEILGISTAYVNKLGTRILKGLPPGAVDKKQRGNGKNRAWRLDAISALDRSSTCNISNRGERRMKKGRDPEDGAPVYHKGYVVPRQQVADFAANLPLGRVRASLAWLQTLCSALSIGDSTSLDETRRFVVNHVARQLTNEGSEELLGAIVSAAERDREAIEAARLTVALLINLLTGYPDDDRTLAEMAEANRISLMMIEPNGVH